MEAEALITLRQGSVVEKRRYKLPGGNVTWEVDVFSGENLGLVIAEIELRHEHQHIDLPPWIGVEVTGRPGRPPYYIQRLPGTAPLQLLAPQRVGYANGQAGLSRVLIAAVTMVFRE